MGFMGPYWAPCGCKADSHSQGECNIEVPTPIMKLPDQMITPCVIDVEESQALKAIRKDMDDHKDDIELQARKITRTGQREAAYGAPGKDFQRTAGMWSSYLRMKLKPGMDITPEDMAAMMVMLKLSRLAETPHHHDSKVDAIGYMICYDRLKDED